MTEGKMKAALFYGGKEDIRVETIDTPPLGDGDVLLKVKTCGICGSDARSYFNGVEQRYKIPVIFGHELAAEVAETGRRVEGYKAGDRVVVAPIYGCGRCEFCTSGRENLCESVVVFGCTFDGGYADYMRIPRKGVERGALVKIGRDISDAEGTMVEPLSCCLHGLRRVRIQPGDPVVVFGAGPIGLSHLILAKKLGAGTVGVVDFVENRLKEARAFGADVVFNSTKDGWEADVRGAFGKNGVDVVVTAAPATAAIDNALKIVKNDGRLLLFGGLPHGHMLTVNPNQIHYNEITITGSIDATMDDFKRAAAMAPTLGLSRFVTHTFPLEMVKDGMETMRRKEGLKVILETGG